MQAAVLSTGTELTRGELVNTNATWLSEALTSLGFDVVEHLTVDDDRARIVEALRSLSQRVGVVVCTGGLGPTTDDLTASAVAEAMGLPLVRDEASLERIRQFFVQLGRPMGPWNEKQADLPEGCTVLPNANGTAPGFAVQFGRARMFFMPGVPREMKTMFQEHATPAIASIVERRTHQIHLRTLGLGESEIQQRLEDLEAAHPGITLGYRAHMPEVEVKVHARAESEAAAQRLATEVAEIVRTRLGDVVYGERDDTFPGVLGQLLRNRGLTLALAESCTGGLVGEMLTATPGSSDYLLLDVVAYANGAKTQVLGVEPEIVRAHGSVSSEVACAMAEGVLRVGHSDLALSITGIAGPTGGSDEKPVGTVHFALARRGQPTEHFHRVFHGDRERIRTLAAYTALRLIHRAAKGS